MKINKQKIKNFIKENKEYFIGAGVGIGSVLIFQKIKKKIDDPYNKADVILSKIDDGKNIFCIESYVTNIFNKKHIAYGLRFNEQFAKAFYNDLTDILKEKGVIDSEVYLNKIINF